MPLLRGVGLAIAPGEVRGLVGESGAGKSMIARAIFGLLPGGARITRGAILFEARDLATMTARRAPRAPRRADRAHPAGSDDVAQPGEADRRTDRDACFA